SMRCTRDALSWQGNGRRAATVIPSASSVMVIESAATPGNATWTCRPSGDSRISTGGSQAACAWVKKCRCSRSARSRIDSASLHIKPEKCREVMALKWRRRPPESRALQQTSLAGTARLLQQPLTESSHRRTLRDDLRAHKIVRADGLQLDVERRHQPAGS